MRIALACCTNRHIGLTHDHRHQEPLIKNASRVGFGLLTFRLRFRSSPTPPIGCRQLSARMNLPTTTPRIQFQALLYAWVTMVFGTSALMALVRPLAFAVYSPNRLLNFLQSTWAIADEVGPLVKIAIIVVFAALVWAGSRVAGPRTWAAYPVNVLAGISAHAIVLGLLPQAYSRGFGIGLTGTRFDERIIGFYLVGAVLGGLLYTYLLRRLSRKKR